jgi:hypothetical protein
MERYNATSLPRLYIIDGNRKITQIREGFHSEEKFTRELTDEIERLLKNV